MVAVVVPRGQEEQEALEMLPVEGLYVPTGQKVGLVEDRGQ
jgi:hypothetical protein